MKEFNYRRAHTEWAVPEFHTLTGDVQNLYLSVADAYKGVNQNKHLGMDWLPGFKEQFDAIPAEILAHASHVIYGCGHWDYKDASDWPRTTHGAHWKFELLAKQNLIDRGFAEYNRFGLPSGSFMDHKEGSGLDHAEIAECFTGQTLPEFETVTVTTINHTPDVFCIGKKHMALSKGMYLDPSVAPCATCGRPYAEHTFKTVLVLRRISNGGNPGNPSEAEATKLKAIVPLLEKYKLDGVAFTK